MSARFSLSPRWALLSIIMVALAIFIAPSASPAPPDPKPNPGNGNGAGGGNGGGNGGGQPTPPGQSAGGDNAAQQSATPSEAPSASSFEDSTVLVGFEAGTTAAEERALAAAVGAAEERVIGAGTHVLHVPAGQVNAKIALLKEHSKVRYAEPDYVVQADMTPNDPDYRKLWGLPRVKADQAWNVTTGSRQVVVGVVDTGVDYTHPDLAANVWTNDSSVNHCPGGTHGYNAITRKCDAMDDHFHGTHVSGTIGAVGNNNIGVVGVNANVSIMGLKFLDATGRGYTSDAVSAIDWAVKAKQAGVNVRVLNNSWGGGGYSRALYDEIEKAGANDILFVAAAGNNAWNNDNGPMYPCGYGTANEICVAATNKNDDRASFSNYGPNSVDLGAPGVGVLSTVPGGGYESYSGTSMATPHVVGAAALILSTGYQPVATLKAMILNSVDQLASLQGVVRTGGRLDVCNALQACSTVAPIPAGFSLSVSPERQAISQGVTAIYTVTLSAVGGFTGLVDLSVTGLPSSASASFIPSQVTLPGSTTAALAVTTDAWTEPGQYTLIVTGADTGHTSSATARLHVTRN